MTMRYDYSTCISSPRNRLGLTLATSIALAAAGCVLTGIEPDEIDVADGETGADGGGDGDGDGDANTGDGDGESTTTGDGDPTGDGDGDPTGDGDGDGDPTGDGDGDPTGDGDGDPTTGGDGDGDPTMTPCDDFGPLEVFDGDNPIDVPVTANSFSGSCGGADGPDAIFSYTATADGSFTFTLAQPEFDGVIYLVGDQCVPLDELACDAQMVGTELITGNTVFIIVDSNQADVGGAATLTITGP